MGSFDKRPRQPYCWLPQVRNFPTDRQPVLKRLPSESLDASISSLVGESFLDQISKKRQEATECRKIKRKKKLNVPPGKSISSEEFKATSSTEQVLVPIDFN